MRARDFGDIIASVEKFKRDWLAYDKGAFRTVAGELARIGVRHDESFLEYWNRAHRSGDMVDSIKKVARRYKMDLAEKNASLLIEKIEALPVSRTYLLVLLGFPFARGIKKFPPKWGDNIDFRHLIAAARDNYFVTLDSGIRALVGLSPQLWPFEVVTPEELLDRIVPRIG